MLLASKSHPLEADRTNTFSCAAIHTSVAGKTLLNSLLIHPRRLLISLSDVSMLKLRSLCFAVILASAFLQPTPLAAAAHDSGLPAVDPAGTDGRGHRIQQIKQVTRWIVVTSIAPPNDVIRRLAALPDWRVVVVADQKTPQNWHCCNVTFLGIDEQADLGYEIVKHIPFNNYGYAATAAARNEQQQQRALSSSIQQ